MGVLVLPHIEHQSVDDPSRAHNENDRDVFEKNIVREEHGSHSLGGIHEWGESKIENFGTSYWRSIVACEKKKAAR